jgi:hypothetical protein
LDTLNPATVWEAEMIHDQARKNYTQESSGARL